MPTFPSIDSHLRAPVSDYFLSVLAADPSYGTSCDECNAPAGRPCRNTKGYITKRHERRATLDGEPSVPSNEGQKESAGDVVR
jgi:hypothetical protein